MSKHDFPETEFASRRLKTREAMAGAGLDWLLVFHPVSIHWLTGADAKSYQAFQCIPLSASQGPVGVFTRKAEYAEYRDDAYVDDIWTWGGGEPADPISDFEKVAALLGIRQGRVGIEVPSYYLHPHHYVRLKQFLGSSLVAEPTNLIHDLKLVKSPLELRYIREASRIADIGMAAFARSLYSGQTELAVAGEVYRALLTNGSGLPASTLNLVSGERAGFAHGAPTHRRLRSGDFGNVEFGSTFRRYTATIGRQFSIGTPTARMVELYDLARHAGDACIAQIRSGVSAVVPHEAAKRVFYEAGMDEYRVHTSGYGLAPGFPPSWGEPLHLFGGSEYTLQAGMVISVEPPVFVGEERLGARLIDNVLVTDSGAELLSGYDRALIVIN